MGTCKYEMCDVDFESSLVHTLQFIASIAHFVVASFKLACSPACDVLVFWEATIFCNNFMLPNQTSATHPFFGTNLLRTWTFQTIRRNQSTESPILDALFWSENGVSRPHRNKIGDSVLWSKRSATIQVAEILGQMSEMSAWLGQRYEDICNR
jgi:hypothetical protein